MIATELVPNAGLTATADSLGLGGLRAANGSAFPLREVSVRAALAGPCARTVVEQHFTNPFDSALDVTWIFPLPDTSAIIELELIAGDIRVVGECHERSAAQALFDAARTNGKRAALVTKEQGHVHTLSLAGLPARCDVTVRFTLVELLPSVEGRFRWQFPTTIAPRYTPGTPVSHEGAGVAPDTDAVPNASRLSPPLRLEGGTRLDLDVEIAGPVTSLASSLHALRLNVDGNTVRVAPSVRATLNRDFILEFSTADDSKAVTRAWTDGAHTLVLVEPPANPTITGMPRDAVFAVDISGSMQGAKMEAAKCALVGALHGLRGGDRFKLIAFDDRVERFADDFIDYTDRNLQAADAWIGRLTSRGGTEMLEPVQECLAGTTPEGRLRTVLFITDGQSNDEARLLPAVANRKGNALFFTLGIDTAVNASLLKSLARAGGGVCELCTPHDDIDVVVARLESRFGTPLLTDIRAAGAARPDAQVVFAGRPASLLLEGAPASVRIDGRDTSEPFSVTVAAARIAFPIGALWAMQRVQWLEERLTLRPFEEEAIRPEIVRIALEWHLSSRFTSFVCVDHSTIHHGERRHVVQPTELPESWEVAEPAPTGIAAMRAMAMRTPPPAAAAYLAEPLTRAAFASWDVVAKASEGPRYGRTTQPGASNDPPAPRPPAMPPRNVDKASFISSLDGLLARAQSANGSYRNNVDRTCAALILLLLRGNTRSKGDRRRTLQKAAEWLQMQQLQEPKLLSQLVLETLDETEKSGALPHRDWHLFITDTPEGQLLEQFLQLHVKR